MRTNCASRNAQKTARASIGVSLVMDGDTAPFRRTLITEAASAEMIIHAVSTMQMTICGATLIWLTPGAIAGLMKKFPHRMQCCKCAFIVWKIRQHMHRVDF